MRRNLIAVASVTLFWTFVAVLYAGQIWWMARQPGERVNLRLALAWQVPYFMGWIPFTLIVWRITSGWLPETAGGWARYLLRHVPVFAAVAVLHLAVVTLAALLIGGQDEPFAMAVMAQFRGRMHLQLLTYTAIAGFGAALTLQAHYRDRQLAAARLEAELSAARLEALRVHLQPHFLFNSLHSIASLARTGDTAGVVHLIAGFSDLLRHLLDAREQHLPLKEEMALVERYLEIQRVRFADRLNAVVEVAPDAADARVPLLLVQPLVENALRHGLGPQIEAGRLTVRAVREREWTRIDVEDTGVGLPRGWSLATTKGTGLRNLVSRLAAEFGSRYAFEVVPRDGGGVRATIRVPRQVS